eukprot:jgi/Tetstr1/440469/TSEL_028795.t1
MNKRDAPLDPDAPDVSSDFLRFILHFDGGVNISAGERGFENARLKSSGDMHPAGLPTTLLHEVITVGVGRHHGERYKLAIRLSIFAITAAMGDDGKVTLRTSAMHPSELEADIADKNRWSHIPLYKWYLPYHELGARRMLRRNKKRMVPSFKDLLLEGSKSWGTKVAIESIGCYTERLLRLGSPVGMEPFIHPMLTLVSCGYRGHTYGLWEGAGGEACAGGGA